MADIVQQVAEIILPGIFNEWYDGTGPEANVIASPKMKFERANALSTASQVVKYLMKYSPQELRDLMVESEIEGWKRLGIPESSALSDAVKQKFSEATLRADTREGG